ncbi:L-threonylcarbamoyladenylate synthase [Chitinophagaceae bacterium LB-8]|uniref:L-threonylcarbamoyladenylate synthase n=1 Tax=Paraflavisolibacter caeni TaxID=2982496 RepID=A0A9X2XV53_9BACT|nr:L-threonylcarbamoyladenylate synthase [Paraflavisolibacter caeni]MCU7548957.1 L-threonylcarbamoyladenylate synthase [Paraflavisolibacter caeni]
MKQLFDQEVERALQVLRNGGTILYPTDTVWGIGCDAANEFAIRKVFEIKKREDSKSMIVLVADERDILQYVAAPDPGVFDFIQEQTRPTTIIFENAIGLPSNLVAQDGSIAIRIVRDEFCRHLIKRLHKPLVSTSANISGEPTPQTFSQITEIVRQQVDYVVQWRKDDVTPSLPSQIIKWNNDGTKTIIRA